MKRLESLIARLRPARYREGGWLLVRPPSGTADCWQWCRQPGGQSGSWPPPADALDQRTALVIPAASSSHFQIPAPPGLKRHEWPLLLEDLLQQPADQVQVECLSRHDGCLELLVMDRATLNDYLADCETLGVTPARVWAEHQLLPQPPAGQVMRWTRPNDDCLVRTTETGTQQWLYWPHALGPQPDEWQLTGHEMAGDWPSEWASLERLPGLQYTPAARRARAPRRVLLSRFQVRMAGICAALALCWMAVIAVQFWQQVPGWKAQVQAVTGPVADAGQAARALSRLQAQQTDWRSRQQQVAELEAAVADWLTTQPGWGVSGNYFDGRNWRLVLNGSAAAPAPSHWQAMGNAVGATASVAADEKASLLTVNFDLGAQP